MGLVGGPLKNTFFAASQYCVTIQTIRMVLGEMVLVYSNDTREGPKRDPTPRPKTRAASSIVPAT